MIDFDRTTSKFEREQQKRREEAKKRKAQESKLQEAQRAREAELARLAIERKAEEERLALARQAAEEEELRVTGGIRFCQTFLPYAIEGEDDKVILPEDCLTTLTEQDAFGKRPVLFRLQARCHGRSEHRQSDTKESFLVSHCGVREFSAQPGRVGLPPKIIQTLGGDLSLIDSIELKYVVLSKCTFVQLKPKENKFFEVGPVKRCLEENLRYYSTLTVGDVFTVWYRGQAYNLVVKEMRPEPQCSLLDTDVEVDLQLSEEFEKAQEQQIAEQPPARTLLSPPPAPSTATSSSSSNTSSDELWLTHLNAPFTATEPPASENNGVVLAKFKLPSGKSLVRRFYHNAPLLDIFRFLWKEGSVDRASSLQISTRFPLRMFTLHDAMSGSSLNDCGLAVAQEQFLVNC
eukprot:gene8372-9228_t